MPEGHVIHGLARKLATFSGHPLKVSSPQGRFAVEAARLDGAELLSAEAVGKHLLLRFDVPDPANVHIHLGLIGKLRIAELAAPRGVVRLRIADDQCAADLHGPQWCRLISDEQRAAVLAKSGPDPIRADADPTAGFHRVRRSAKSIAALLMDQQVAAGVGNIFRAEVLFRNSLDPSVPGKEISQATWDALWSDLVTLMVPAVSSGRIDTVLPEHSPQAQRRPAREDPHGGEVYVYRRAGQPCLVCGTEIRKRDLAGRNLYWCPNCQQQSTARHISSGAVDDR